MKSAESSPFTMHGTACAVGRTQQAATDDTIAWPPGDDGLRRWENHTLSSFRKTLNRTQSVPILKRIFIMPTASTGAGGS